MMTDTRTDEITRYVTQVRDGFGHLPEETRTELVEDPPTHLAEVTADAVHGRDADLIEVRTPHRTGTLEFR